MQQLYQASYIRASAAQAHAFEEMMQRNRGGGSVFPSMPLPMFVPPPVFSHTHKDKPREHAK